MDQYLQLLLDNQRLLGEFDPKKVSDLTPQWFWDRWIDLIDFRGDLQIRSQNVVLGRKVCIITTSHIINDAKSYVPASYKHVWIEGKTYIGSHAILFNCHIQEGAVVAVGAVVKDIVVPAYTMVEGNPAKIVGEWNGYVWRRVRQNDN